MSASGDLPSIGAPTVGEKCPDRSGETLVKGLQPLCASPPRWGTKRGELPLQEFEPGLADGVGLLLRQGQRIDASIRVKG